MSGAPLAPLIEEFARRLRTGAPAPRGMPYLALESASGSGSHLLDALSTHGIFRKYELVLDLDGGLGATGRWLVGRLGCTAVVTAADPATAAGGHVLTRRAGLRGRVQHVRAAPHALPFGVARFTHAWLVETLPRLSDVPATLAEAWRVVRPGGHLAVQELVHREGSPAPAIPGWRFTTGAARQDAIAAAGFVDLVVREVADAGEHSARVTAARQQFQAELAATPARAVLAAERTALTAALADGRLRLVQLFGRRP